MQNWNNLSLRSGGLVKRREEKISRGQPKLRWMLNICMPLVFDDTIMSKAKATKSHAGCFVSAISPKSEAKRQTSKRRTGISLGLGVLSTAETLLVS